MLEIIVIVGIIILLVIMDRLIKKNKINFKFVYLNFTVLLLFIIIVLLLMIPQVSNLIVDMVGFIPRDVLLALAIAYLFYASFIQGILIAKQNEKIDRIAQLLSVSEALDKKEKNEKNRDTN